MEKGMEIVNYFSNGNTKNYQNRSLVLDLESLIIYSSNLLSTFLDFVFLWICLNVQK